MEFKVYLAGPITGQSYDGATDWREYTKLKFYELCTQTYHQIHGLSPMRHKSEFLRQETKIEDTYEHDVMSCQRGIYGRDKLDCHRADLVIANFLGADRVSIGTVMEVAWAAGNGIPVILVMENEGNPHEHAMIREAAYWRVDNLDEAIITTYKILVP